MTEKKDLPEDELSPADKTEEIPGFPGCSPGCGCGEPPLKGRQKLKVTIFLVVVAAVVGILIFKPTNARQSAIDPGSAGFAAPRMGAVINSSGQQGGSGAAISVLAELTTLASNLDTVFLLIPLQDPAPPGQETETVLAAAEKILNDKGLSTGIYTLKTTSPDYPDIAAEVTPPGIAVLTKGRGTGFVTGRISEATLMQAYVASTRSGGCSSGGCPLPKEGQTAAPCN